MIVVRDLQITAPITQYCTISDEDVIGSYYMTRTDIYDNHTIRDWLPTFKRRFKALVYMYIRLAKLRRSPQLGLLESTLSILVLPSLVGISLALLLVGVCFIVLALESVLSHE